MLGLLPTELHQYSILDAARGLRAVRNSGNPLARIPLQGLGDAIPIRSARAAAVIALQALGMPPGSKIGVPLYCCPVVFKAIKAAGCAPQFLDMDPATFCLSPEDLRAKQSRIDALIAVHMFGNVCDMPSILAIMKGKPVIEDCAQSLGSKLEGGPCGSFGDVAFFSFRLGKYLSVGEGGALFSANVGLRARITELIERLTLTPRIEEMKHVMATYVRAKLRGRRWWGLVGSRIWAFYNRNTAFADKSPLVLGRMFVSDFAILLRRMPQLSSRIATQRIYADRYTRRFRRMAVQICLERPGTYYNRFMYPIVFASEEERDALAKDLRNRGIGTSTPYADVTQGAKAVYGYRGDCPITEQILKRALVIPVFHALRSVNVERIAQCISASLNQADALLDVNSLK
jgi:perosamine synthetase